MYTIHKPLKCWVSQMSWWLLVTWPRRLHKGWGESRLKGGSCAIQHPKNELNSLLFHQWESQSLHTRCWLSWPQTWHHYAAVPWISQQRPQSCTHRALGKMKNNLLLISSSLILQFRNVCCCFLCLVVAGGADRRGMQLTALIRSWIIASTRDEMSDRKDGWRCFDQGLKYDSRAKGQSQWRQFWFTINCCLLTTQ